MIIDKKKGDKMKIVDIIKSNFAISMEKGELVYNYIVTEMSKGAVPIHLDFLGIETTITTFFNSSYGRLFEKYTQEEVDKNIIFENLKPISSRQLKYVRDNAIQFYRKEGAR